MSSRALSLEEGGVDQLQGARDDRALEGARRALAELDPGFLDAHEQIKELKRELKNIYKNLEKTKAQKAELLNELEIEQLKKKPSDHKPYAVVPEGEVCVDYWSIDTGDNVAIRVRVGKFGTVLYRGKDVGLAKDMARKLAKIFGMKSVPEMSTPTLRQVTENVNRVSWEKAKQIGRLEI